MNIALGMIVKNERPILEKTLNHKALWFDTKVAVDFMSNDYTNELLGLSYGFYVQRQEWTGNYATARNILIQVAEEAGADYLFMLDADESMTQAGINECRALAEKHDALALPRFEFVKDFHHYDPTLYPDYQCRFFRLHKGYHFRNRVHEMLHTTDGKPVLASNALHMKVPSAPIYHYSRIKDHKSLTLKYVNYDRMLKNLTPLQAEELTGYDPNARFWEHCEPFTHYHPLQNCT